MAKVIVACKISKMSKIKRKLIKQILWNISIEKIYFLQKTPDTKENCPVEEKSFFVYRN